VGVERGCAGGAGSGNGIGMRNVRERMEVLYGTSEVDIVSRPGGNQGAAGDAGARGRRGSVGAVRRGAAGNLGDVARTITRG